MRLVELYSVRLEAPTRSSEPSLKPCSKNLASACDWPGPLRKRRLGSRFGEDHVNTLSQRIEAQHARAAEARAAEARAVEAESEAADLAELLMSLATLTRAPDFRSHGRELAKRKSIEAELAEAHDAIASSVSNLASLREEVGRLVNTPELVDSLRRSLNALRPAHERHLKDSALAGSLPALLEERESARAKINQAGQAVERSKRLLEKRERQFDPESLSKARDQESAHQTEVGALQSRREQLDAEVKQLQKNGWSCWKSAGIRGPSRESQTHREAPTHNAPDPQLAARRGSGGHEGHGLRSVGLCKRDILRNHGQLRSIAPVDEQYGIWLESGGYRRSFRQLSGGEQITAALSVRLALLRDLLRIDTAFLDEPTQNLAHPQGNLAEQIQRITGFSQLFVISHDDTFERLLQSVIHVEKIDGVSRVRVQ